MTKLKCGILFALFFLLVGCGQPETCYICEEPIQPGEHVVYAFYSSLPDDMLDISHMSTEEVVCEKCQYQYIGTISGHCDRCLAELEEDALIYRGYEYEGADAEIDVCEACATELWGSDRDSHLPGPSCSSCGASLENNEYENTGVCKACAKIIYN